MFIILCASHLVDYISVHIRFDLERYLLIILILDESSHHVKDYYHTDDYRPVTISYATAAYTGSRSSD